MNFNQQIIEDFIVNLKTNFNRKDKQGLTFSGFFTTQSNEVASFFLYAKKHFVST